MDKEAESPSGDAAAPCRAYNGLVLFLLVLAFLVGGAMRIDASVRLYAPNEISPYDAKRCYEATADALLAGKGWNSNHHGNFIPPPLHPVFLAAVKYMIPGADYHTMRSIQVMLSILAIGIAYPLGAMLGTRLTGAIAALILAVDPDVTYWSAKLYTESNFLFLLLAFLALLLYGARRKSALLMGLSGIALGLTCLQRPVPMLLAALIPMYLVCRYHDKRHIAKGLVFFAGFALVVFPWTIRNYIRYDGFYVISTNGGHMLARSNFLGLDSTDRSMRYGNKFYHSDIWKVPEIEAEFEGRTDKYGAQEWNLKDKAYARHAVQYIKNHPGHFLKNYFVKIYNSLRYPEQPTSRTHLDRYDIPHRSWLIAFLYKEWRIGLAMLGLLGLGLFGIRERREPRLLMFFVQLYFVAIAGLVVDLTSARYTLAMKVFLGFFAAYLVSLGLESAYRRASGALQRRRQESDGAADESA